MAKKKLPTANTVEAARRQPPILTTLAKQFAPEFDKAPWADVEDDVSLAVWAQRVTGEFLTLEETGKFRELLDAEVAKFPKVVVYISGGVLQGCTSNDPRLKVVLIDRDNLEEEADPELAESEALEGSEDCIHDVY